MGEAGRTSRGTPVRRRIVMAALACALTAVLASGGSDVLAQAEAPAPGTVVRVANTDGQALNLRAGPSTEQPILARLAVGEALTVTGTPSGTGSIRWLPVRTGGGQDGWVAADFVAVASTRAPAPTRAPESTPTLTPVGAVADATERRERDGPTGRPVDVEAKLKYPELSGREQEIRVWVTRAGAPVPGAIVTLETSDGDDDERFRQLDPTNDEGWTRRVFDVRREKGTVELRVEAVAPDGGEGRTVVSYFRR
jgi:uncharacterized protein YraI